MCIRACTLPVAEPVGSSWKEFRDALTPCFRLSTDLANWCVHSLFRIDTPNAKEPDAVKKWYGYGVASESYPDWPKWVRSTKSASCLIRGVHRKYRQTRFDVMVKHDAKALTYRYPYPFPFHNQSWSTSYVDGDFPAVSLPIPGLGRITLRLRREKHSGRQLAMFRQLHDNPDWRCEAALYENGKGNVMLKLVGDFPARVRTAEDRIHACFLHSDPHALLVAEIDNRSPWILNADHLKRWQAVHRVYRQRASEDSKREKRMDRRQRAHLNKSREMRCDKHNARLDTALHQLSAQVVRFIERQRVGTVAYDDTNNEYIPDGFPWHELKTKLRYKLEGMGVEWLDGSYVSLNNEERNEWLLKARALLVAARRASAHKSRARRKSHPAVSVAPATSAG